MASSRPVFRFYVDWLNDGDFTDTNDEVTSTSGGNAMAADGATIAYGRDQARAFSPVRAGEAAFKLNNAARIYSPENSGSPLFGQLVPGRPVQITATQDAATTIIYRGFLDDYTVNPNKGDRTVTMSCLDALARFQQANPLSTPLYAGIRTGTAIGLILDALGWPGGARDLDPGASTIRWWWEEGTDGLTALTRMLAAEGPPAICFVDTNANFVYRDRHHRLIRSASYTRQCTFSNGAVPESGGGYDALIAAASPLAWWKLADAAGAASGADSSGNSRPATATAIAFGSPESPVTGNTAASLTSASTPKLLTSYNPSFASGLTAEAWVNLNGLSQGGANPRLNTNSHTDTDHNGYQMWLNGSQPAFAVGNGTTAATAFSSVNVPSSGWTQVTGTYDGTTVRIYVNGTQTGTASLSGTVPAGSASGISLGYAAAYNGDYLNGLLAECAVYSGAASASAVAARYAAALTAVTYSQPMTYDTGWRDIVNTIIVPVDQRDQRELGVVWQTDATIAVPAGSTTTVIAQASDPFMNAVTPVAGTDFTLLTGTSTASLSRTSGQSTTITLTDSGSGSLVTGLQLRAHPVTVSRTVQVSVSSPTSVTAYGVRGLPSGIDLGAAGATVEDVVAVASIFVARYAQRQPIVTIPVANLNGGRLTQQLARDLSDRVHITDTETGLNADFFIDQISHATSGHGRVLVTTFGCEKADATSPSNLFTFDDATNGKFGTGKFGT